MIRNLLCFLIALLFIANTARAQAPNYAFLATSGTYTPITGGTNVTLTYNGATNNDDGVAIPANAIPIGFTFNYNGTDYTTIRPCANGFAVFSSTAVPNNTDTWTNNLTSGMAGIRTIIAPLWDDMDMVSASGVSYVLTGSSPNRVLTIQWTNARWEYAATSGVISFQVKLYETSNVIEFIYQQETGTIANAGDLGASIGITSGASGSGSFLSLSDAGTNPSVSSTAETTSINTKPATGQIYRWSPYCTAGALDVTAGSGGEKIARVRYNTIDNSSTSVAAYENFSSISTIVQPSSTLPVIVNVSPAYTSDQIVIFIDFNHNGLFTDAGEMVFSNTVPIASAQISGNITIPALSANVLLGPARMRIRLHDTGDGPNATPCGNSTWGQVEDYTVNIQLCSSATISTQPADVIICNAGSGSISIGATGSGLTYQWQVSTNGGTTYTNLTNGAPYTGVTTNTLTITNASVSMNGYLYKVIINGTCTPPNLASTAAMLTINTPGAITTNPVNTNFCRGTTASFNSAASGSSPSYQWQVSTDGGVNYSNLTGANSAILTINGVALALNGNRYRSVATIASCGSVTSSAAILTVNELPVVTISVAPVSQILPGVTTTITAGSVPVGVSYAWTLNGSPIAGATTNSVIADVSGRGRYSVTVTDINGCKNTSAGLDVTALESPKLFIYPNPSNGQFQIRLFSWSSGDYRTVTIYNSSGIMVARQEFFVNDPYIKMDFDLRKLARGMYTVRITHKFENKELVAQIIIQ